MKVLFSAQLLDGQILTMVKGASHGARSLLLHNEGGTTQPLNIKVLAQRHSMRPVLAVDQTLWNLIDALSRAADHGESIEKLSAALELAVVNVKAQRWVEVYPYGRPRTLVDEVAADIARSDAEPQCF